MEPTESFNLRWHDFETNTCGVLKELRDEREFCDVTLACDGKQVAAHKVILAGGSKFFKQILKQNPHPHPLLYLKGVRYEYLLSMLDFVYTGEANINEKELTAFLDVANDLQIKGLIEKNTSRVPSTKEGVSIPSNVSLEDEHSAVKKESEPLLHAETPSYGNNQDSQSTCKEDPIDAPLDANIKVELDDPIHSTTSFYREENHGGLNEREDMVDFKSNVSNSYKISNSFKKGQMTADWCEQSENFTPPDQLQACQQKSDLPLRQEFSGPYCSSSFVKSNCNENHNRKKNHDRNQVLVDDNVKTNPGDTSSFHVNFEEEDYVERHDFLRGVDHNDHVFSYCDMSGREPVDSISKDDNEKNAHYWYEEVEKYKGDGEGNVKHNDQEFSTMKKGKKVCSVCGKSARDNFALKEHMRTHTGEKPFPLGPKTFRKSTHLKKHTQIHTEEKPFSCGVCPKTFATSYHLKVHTRFHTGEKPFHCLVCFKRFTRSDELNLHKKKCSMKLGE